MMINYDEERPKGKDAEICNSANPIQKNCKDLLSCTFYDLDWKVAQDRCLVYLNHECSDVRVFYRSYGWCVILLNGTYAPPRDFWDSE